MVTSSSAASGTDLRSPGHADVSSIKACIENKTRDRLEKDSKKPGIPANPSYNKSPAARFRKTTRHSLCRTVRSRDLGLSVRTHKHLQPESDVPVPRTFDLQPATTGSQYKQPALLSFYQPDLPLSRPSQVQLRGRQPPLPPPPLQSLKIPNSQILKLGSQKK